MVSLFYGDMKHTVCRNGKGNPLFCCLHTVKDLNANRLRRFKGVLILHMAGYDLGFDLVSFFSEKYRPLPDMLFQIHIRHRDMEVHRWHLPKQIPSDSEPCIRLPDQPAPFPESLPEDHFPDVPDTDQNMIRRSFDHLLPSVRIIDCRTFTICAMFAILTRSLCLLKRFRLIPATSASRMVFC